VPGKPPIVVIVFDEFAGLVLNGPDGRVDASRYPNFARFARNATWYRNATTVADFTDRAVPALLTGEMPDKGALPIAADHPESLFTLLGGRYSLEVIEPTTDICPERLCPEEAAERQPAGQRRRALVDDLSLVSLHLLLPEPLTDDLEPVDRSFGDFRTADAVQPDRRAPPSQGRVLAALKAVAERVSIFRAFEQRLEKAPPRGYLAFLHVQLPHNPYHFLPSGQRYPETVPMPPGIVADTSPPAARGARTQPWRVRDSSATCSRWATLIGCSDGHWTS
jgi:hypothetical protein